MTSPANRGDLKKNGLPALAAHAASISTCTYCPRLCRDVCPVAEAERNEKFTPTLKAATAQAVLNGHLPLDQEVAEVFYACTGCGASKPRCRHDIESSRALLAGRQEAVRLGVVPQVVQSLADRMAQHGSPYRQSPREAIAKVLQEAGVPDVPAGVSTGQSSTILFSGCDVARREPGLIGTAMQLAKACRSQGAEALSVYEGEPFCCGYPLKALGFERRFADHARRVGRALEGVERVVTLSPACALTLGRHLPDAGVAIRATVAPFVSWLAHYAKGLSWSPGSQGLSERRIVYHDGCMLGRHLGVRLAPRSLLEWAVGHPPVEMPQCGEETRCAGGGAGYSLVFPDSAMRVAEQRLNEVRAVGGDLVVSGCPTSRRLLGQASQAERDRGVSDPVDVESLLGMVLRSLKA